MSKLVTIYGGSGFLGRYIARRMAKQGWRVRVAVRRPNEALFVKPYGAVGQVEPVLCNIRDDASVRAAMQGASVVVNCVGTFDRAGRNNFRAVQTEGAARIATLAAEAGISRMVHISAIGAAADSPAIYGRTKAQGEAAIMAALPDAVILRPAIMFGPEDGFFNRFAGMVKFGPILPLVGAKTKFQPVYVDNVAAAAEAAILGQAAPGIYELGGPETDSLAGWIGVMLSEIRRRRLVLGLPFWIGSVIAVLADACSALTLGLVPNKILTRDQLASLRVDNVVSGDFPGLADLGIEPTPVSAVIPKYLWPARPSGQFAEITASAKNLRT